MPIAIVWTTEMDDTLRFMVSNAQSFEAIGPALGMNRETAVRRARTLGIFKSRQHARTPNPPAVPALDRRQDALPAGHPYSWNLINRGLSIEGEPYPPGET